MSNEISRLNTENKKLREIVQELQSRVVDVDLKQKSINSILNLVNGGKVVIEAKKEREVGIAIKNMAEPLYDWLCKKEKKVNLSI